MKLEDIISRVVVDERKLTDYALNLEDYLGVDTVMFQQHLGLTKDNYEASARTDFNLSPRN